MKCMVVGCGRTRRTDPLLSFHRFPKDLGIRRAWISFCVNSTDEELHFNVKGSTRVCEIHFVDGNAKNYPTVRGPIPDELGAENNENVGTLVSRLREKVVKLER
ncbi:hypothetical protein quinque_005829 [Culex quinquefasciatus]